MKKLNLILSVILLTASLAFAQGGAVTPSATPFGASRNTEWPKVYHYKVKLDQIKALGAATSGNIKLYTTQAQRFSGDVRDTAPQEVINWIVIQTTTPVTGGSLSAATARVQTSGNNYGSTRSVFTANGSAVMYSVAAAGAIEAGAVDVNLALTSTGDNLVSATAGEVDVYVCRTLLR